MKLRREETGVEFDVFNDRAAVADVAGEHDDPRFERSANFRWGGDQSEMMAGLCAAAALARLTNGVVLDGQEDRLLSIDEAIELANQILQSCDRPRMRRSPARAAAASVLPQAAAGAPQRPRPDRPAADHPAGPAHRAGAVLGRGRDKHSIKITPFVCPLYRGSVGLDYPLGERVCTSGTAISSLCFSTRSERSFSRRWAS